MTNMIVTTSWDDGHVLDRRLADLLRKYKLAATFYVAPRDHEFEPGKRLSEDQIRELGRDFEIGAHTMTHPRLTEVSDSVAEGEMRDSKQYLERVTGQPVTCFCYPAGLFRFAHRAMAGRLGFTYARTVGRFTLGRPADRLAAGTTVHAYRHWSDLLTIARFARFNPVKFGRYYFSWDKLAMAQFDRAQALGGVFHLWGHSWEIDQRSDWARLERVLKYISGRENVSYVTNQELAGLDKPTVLMTTPYFYPHIGGLENYVLNLAHELERHEGWRVVIATTTEPGQAEGVYEVEGLRVHRLGGGLKLANTRWSSSWARKLRQIIELEQPDVVNAHAPVPGMAEATALAVGRRPLVLNWHAGPMRKGHWAPDLLTGTYERVVVPWLVRRSKTVICNSSFVRSAMMGRAPERKIRIVHPGVDVGRFTPAKRLARDTVLFVGSMNHSDQYKGLGRIIDAMALVQEAHPEAKLLAVGSGNHRKMYEEQARVRRLNFAFTGALHGDEVVQAFGSATVLALPTTNDSYPTVVMEAMASGLPVVTMATGDIPTMVLDGVTGTLTTLDTRQLADDLLMYLDDHARAARAGAAGRKQVVERHSWRERAVATAKIFAASRQPKIAQIVSYYPPHIGGMENVVKELSFKLAEQGYDTEVLTSRAGGGSRSETPEEAAQANLTVRRLPGFEAVHTPVMFGLFWQLLRQPRRSVFHVHVAQALSPEATIVAAKLRGVPMVAHVHLDVDPSSPLGEVFFRPYKRIILRRVLRAADRVVVLSPDQRDLMIRLYGLDPERVSVLPNGVSRRYFMTARKQAHTPLRLLYVGRLAVQKRPERLVEVAAKLGSQVQLDIVGDGEDRPKLEQLARKLQLDNVIFHGFKVGDELLEFYKNADVFILPSDKEGLPLVMLEAMAAALPVVGSDVIGIREHLEGVGVLVANPSADTFAKAVSELIGDAGQFVKLSNQSRQRAESYAWEHLCAQLGAMYHEVQP